MVGKEIRGRIYHFINRYAKANNKYMSDYDKNKELPYLKYWDVNNLYGWAMSPKLPVNGFGWAKNISGFDKGFIKSYNEESDEGYFLEVDIQYLENSHNLHNYLPYLSERIKSGKVYCYFIQ